LLVQKASQAHFELNIPIFKLFEIDFIYNSYGTYLGIIINIKTDFEETTILRTTPKGICEMSYRETATNPEKLRKQIAYIKDAFKGKGLSDEAAELIAWATVNKEARILKNGNWSAVAQRFPDLRCLRVRNTRKHLKSGSSPDWLRRYKKRAILVSRRRK
jgi:hypothetical protein